MARRRRSRGGRGRGRGGRGPRPALSNATPALAENSGEVAPEPAGPTPEETLAGEAGQEEDESFFAPSPDMEVPDQPAGSASKDREPLPPRAREGRHIPPPARPLHPAHPESIRKAIDDVMEVIASLRESLEQMDEVLELLEEAERQKTADEREIESLRQALRRFQRPPDEGPRHRPSQQAGGHREPHRSPRDQRDQRDQRGHREQRAPHGPSRSVREPSGTPAVNEPRDTEQPSSAHGTDAGDPS